MRAGWHRTRLTESHVAVWRIEDDGTLTVYGEPSRYGESEPAVSRQPSTDVPERLGPDASVQR